MATTTRSPWGSWLHRDATPRAVHDGLYRATCDTGHWAAFSVRPSAIARAFAAAEVEGDDKGLLDPTTLYQMGFDLVREGQSLWLLDVGTGRPTAVTCVDR